MLTLLYILLAIALAPIVLVSLIQLTMIVIGLLFLLFGIIDRIIS